VDWDWRKSDARKVPMRLVEPGLGINGYITDEGLSCSFLTLLNMV